MLLLETDWQIPMTIGLVGYFVVMVALTFLIFIYLLIPVLMKIFIKWKLRRAGKHGEADEEQLSISGHEGAAIALALHLYFEEKHDVESGMITIKKINKQYSPWSSKIYGVSQFSK